MCSVCQNSHGMQCGVNCRNENSAPNHTLRAGMVGMGMIFDETYRPFFEAAQQHGIHDRGFGDVDVELAAVATRTGRRAAKYQQQSQQIMRPFKSFDGCARS